MCMYSAYYYMGGGDIVRQVYHWTKVANESSMSKSLSQHSSVMFVWQETFWFGSLSAQEESS